MFLILLLAHPNPALAQAKGATCAVNGYTAAATQATGGQNLVCSSLTWQYVPYQFGSSSASCPGTGNVTLGAIEWTGSAFQGCTASGWGSLGSGGGTTALSALVAATTTNSISNLNFAQTWTWGTLGANTALTLSSTGMTTGALLNLSNTAAAANAGTVLIVSNSEGGNSTGISSSMLYATNTGSAGYFSNATTNSGYAIYGTMTAHSNTGYGGYFINTDTSTTTNFGVYALVSNTSPSSSAAVYGEGDCGNCTGIYGASANDFGVWGQSSGWGGGEYATQTSNAYAGVAGLDSSTSGSGYGVYGTITGHGNTGYAGYFSNTDAGNDANYGVYGVTAAGNGTGVQGTGLYGVSGNGSYTGVYGYSAGSFGVWGTNPGTGVYGNESGAANTGYGGYSLVQIGPPQTPTSVISPRGFFPLGLLPSHQGSGSRSSTRKPVSDSRPLYAGRRPPSHQAPGGLVPG